MRYAVFSDIHSNLEAYNAVLEAIRREGADSCWCCGDIVGYGADPNACIDITRELNPRIVAGNHDLGAAGLTDISNFSQNAGIAVLWTREALSADSELFLKAMPLRHDNRVTLVHASPNRPEEFEYIFDLSGAWRSFAAMEKVDICFIGHTHAPCIFVRDSEGYVGYIPWTRTTTETGKKYIVNVGSVGQPRDGDPRAAYCVYDADSGIIELKRVRYDVEKTKEKIIRAGLPGVLAERLSLGK
ncbi:MAG: metallophosphoesterase family protein [Candidatus Omnitrophica bacterium]|nr:metallophosphoesterase family protein [Candidatus Omnitrophota bacterium]